MTEAHASACYTVMDTNCLSLDIKSIAMVQLDGPAYADIHCSSADSILIDLSTYATFNFQYMGTQAKFAMQETSKQSIITDNYYKKSRNMQFSINSSQLHQNQHYGSTRSRTMTMWENLLILNNKEQVMNFEILPCDVLTKSLRSCEQRVYKQQHIQQEKTSAEKRLKMGAHRP